ncbi:hypothetical protein [Streptomyces griseus]|nr:hypothetical protein [Streptomyces griseus]
MRSPKRLFALALIATALAFGTAAPASANMHVTADTSYNDLRADN